MTTTKIEDVLVSEGVFKEAWVYPTFFSDNGMTGWVIANRLENRYDGERHARFFIEKRRIHFGDREIHVLSEVCDDADYGWVTWSRWSGSNATSGRHKEEIVHMFIGTRDEYEADLASFHKSCDDAKVAHSLVS